MPFREVDTHLQDILTGVENISLFLGDIDFEAYQLDLKTKSAVERQLQIITEAAHRLGDDADILCPGPDWKAIRGMGNWLRHAYQQIDDAVVWNTVKFGLPQLKEAVLRTLGTK